MIASFALGGWIFSGGDDEPNTNSAAMEFADTTAVVADVPVAEPTPVQLPTTTENTVPVAPSLPPPVTLPAQPPLSEAERAARNDGAIDDLEKAVVDLLTAGFGLPVPTREELLPIGTTTCQLAAASPTRADFEAGLVGPMTATAMPPLQWAVLAGVTGGTMCLDELNRLDLVPAV
jgi:hypothetical protein